MDLIDYTTLENTVKGDGFVYGEYSISKTKTKLTYLDERELCGKFDGIDIFLDVISNQLKVGRGRYNSSQDKGDGDFQMFKTYEEAMDTFKNNPSKVADFMQKDEKILGGDSAGMSVEYDVTGDFIDMGRYVEGIPETFGSMYNGNPRSKRVNILIPAMTSSWVSHRLINHRSKRVKRLVDWLETNQVRCAVTVMFTNDNWHCEIIVKKFDEIFNINDIAIATHSDFFRRCQFKFGENSKTLVGGYGSAVQFWNNTKLKNMLGQEYNNEFNVVIGSKLEYTERIDKDMDDLEKRLSKRIFEEESNETMLGCMLGSR